MLGLSSRTLAFQSISIETHFWADQSQFYFLKLKSKLLTQARAKMSVKFMSRRDKRCILFSMIYTLLCQVYQRIISSRDFVSLKISQLVHSAYRLVHPTTLLLLPSTVWLWKWRDTIQIQYIRHGIHYFNPNGRLIYGKVERGWFLYEQLCFCIVTEKFNSISFSSYSKPVNSLLFWITLSSQLIISTETSHHQPLKIFAANLHLDYKTN